MNICVFLGANLSNNPLYIEATKKMAAHIIQQNATLVYGGSCTGLMGLLADEVLAAGKKVIGILPQVGLPQEIEHRRLSECIYTETLTARTQKMITLADLFIALPGGLGTFEEILSVWNGLRLGEIINKPLIIVNINHYFTPLLQQVENAVTEGLLAERDANLIQVIDSLSHELNL